MTNQDRAGSTSRDQSQTVTEQFTQDLKKLYEINLELTALDSLDILCKRAVELALKHLGIDRLGLFLLDHSTNTLVGAFGTDPEGRVRDESDYRESITANHWTESVSSSPNMVKLWGDEALYDYGKKIGAGWKAGVALWDGHQVMGYVALDNLVTHRPPRPYEVELLSLYGSTIGHLISLKRAEENLRHRESMYRTLAQHLPDTTVLLFDADMRYLVAEGMFLNKLGFSKQDLEGRTITEVLSDGFLENLLPLYQNILQGEAVHLEGEFKTIAYEVSGVPIRNTEGKVSAGLITIRDITSHKRLENDLAAARDAANAANHSKSNFLANMSHELRTPLNAILGFAEVITVDPSLKGKQREHLDIITRSGEHLLGLINDILEISKIEAGKLELYLKVFDTHEMLNTLYRMFQLRAEAKGLQFNLNVAATVPQYVNGDEGKLRQILLNAVSNAIKFTQQGSVSIEVDYDGLEQRLTVAVQDTGMGMSDDEQSALFNPFFQTRSGLQTQQGTGLGLAIVREYVRLMQGHISVLSAIEQGTTLTFDVKLEAVMLAKKPSDTKRQRVIGIVTANVEQPIRILVADDVVANVQLVREWLESVGITVQVAADGKRALEIALAWQPHLIFMDLRMPMLDGYSATEHLRQAFPDLPIIALTASAFEKNKTLTEAGFSGYLRKPIQSTGLFDTLALFLGVEYRYEGEVLAEDTPPSSEEIVEALKELSTSRYTAFKQGVKEVNMNKTKTAVQAIHEENTRLSETLARWIDDFRFDILTDLVEKVEHG